MYVELFKELSSRPIYIKAGFIRYHALWRYFDVILTSRVRRGVIIVQL